MNKLESTVADMPRIIYQFSAAEPVTNQCDACSPIVFATQGSFESINCHDFLERTPQLQSQRIDFENHYAIFSPFARAFTVLNSHAFEILDYFKSKRAFRNLPKEWFERFGKAHITKLIKSMVSLGLLTSTSQLKAKFQEKPQKLAAWLHITDRCNFRCAYCYLPHNKEDMSEETGRAAIDAIFRSSVIYNYREVKLKYAGGEPLLRFQLIKKMHQYAQSLAEKHDIKIDGVVLSNGTLITPSIIKSMQDLELRLTISLDGLDGYQDMQRYYSNGSGSAKTVLNAIDIAMSKGLTPEISVTVTSRNAPGLAELVEWILKQKLHFRINFYRNNKYSESLIDLSLEQEIIIKHILAAFKVIESNLPKQNLLASLANQSNLSCAHLRACSVGHSYLVFDSTGQVSKCQMQKDKPVANVYATDPLAKVRLDIEGIQNLSVEEKQECRDCSWKYWCAGGCPLDTYQAIGRYDAKSPNCHIYKNLLPEIVKLEALRLLKYHSPD
ncbi:MAG: radical SAM protein [Candidatus Atribacteria bacterium]|nr:radical SAM protein [Candidatus Atribacteria bacterium]